MAETVTGPSTHLQLMRKDPETARLYLRLITVSSDEDAPCRQDPELWWSDHEAEQNLAKSLCRQCPALALCQEWALKVREPAGVWGGMTFKERAALVKYQNRKRREARQK